MPHTLEEAYEVVDAIETQDWNGLKGELGDLLFQVVFYAQLGKEQGLFDFADIVDTVSEKLVRRHPHVFSDADLGDEQAVKVNWEAEKAKERAALDKESVLDDIPLAASPDPRRQDPEALCHCRFRLEDAWPGGGQDPRGDRRGDGRGADGRRRRGTGER